MKGKLIKSDIQYRLHNEEGIVIATSTDGKLSIKNCEAIANGYDVFKLAYDSSKEFLIEPTHSPSFTFGYEQGFQKALEILNDKKFSEEDVATAYDKGQILNIKGGQQSGKNYVKSLQQTEWQVEIVTKPYTEVGEGFNLESKREPKLDANGNLILKRI